MRLLVLAVVTLGFTVSSGVTTPVYYDDGAGTYNGEGGSDLVGGTVDSGAGSYDGEVRSHLVEADGGTVNGWAYNGEAGDFIGADGKIVDNGAGTYYGEARSDLVEADGGAGDLVGTDGETVNSGTGTYNGEGGSDLVGGTVDSEAGSYDGEAGSDLVGTDGGTVNGGAGTYKGEAGDELVGQDGESPENKYADNNIEYEYEEIKISKKKLDRLLKKVVDLIKEFFKTQSRPENKLIRKMAERFLTQMETIEQEVCKIWDKEGDKTKADDCRDFLDKVDKAECAVSLGACTAKAVISKTQAAKCIVKNSVDCITSIV